MKGPGKYDDACTVAREAADAHTAILIIIDGIHGHGFSLQTVDQEYALGTLPSLLRKLADDLDLDYKTGDGSVEPVHEAEGGKA